MKKKFVNKILLITVISLFFLPINSEEKINTNSHQYNFYVGNFDFSDDKQKAILFGFQHQNETLERNTC